MSALIFWIGGYVAAPFVFMATLGVFRNLAGMGSGFMKNARGKINEKAGVRRRTDKEIWNKQRDQRRQAESLRRKSNWRNRNDKNADKLKKPKRREWKDAEAAMLRTQASQLSPRIMKGDAIAKGAQIEASAGVVNAQLTYEAEFDRAVAEGDGANARKRALEAVATDLNKKLIAGRATQSEVTGTLQFLAQNKAVKDLNSIQDTIVGIDGANGTRATQQYGSALGNGEAYSALTGLSPGYGYIPLHGGDTKAERVNRIFTEQDGKVATASADAWAEAASVDATRTAKRLADLHAMGGKTAEGLQVPPMPATPDPNNPEHNAIIALHNEINNNPAYADLKSKLR